MLQDTFWYLATPYSKYPSGHRNAFYAAAKQASILVRAGIPVYCPIAHTHPVAMYGGMDPFDHSIWLPADEPFMRVAHGLIVCKMSGWDVSFGIGEEIKFFAAASKPIIYMTPGLVPHELLQVVD